MITKLLEDIKASAKRLPEMEDAVFKAVDHLDEKEAPRFPLSPSAALKPMRDLYYGLVNFHAPGSIVIDPIPAPTKLTFKFGHYVESLLKDYFREAFHLKDEQRRVKFGEVKDKDGKTIELSGAIDWSIVVNGETLLMDSKSIRSYPFKLLDPKGKSLAPKDENVAQMQLYMHSDWGRKNNVNKAILCYFCKDSSEMKCIQISYDALLARAILERLYMVWDCYLKGDIPPREYIFGLDWQADYSNFRTHDCAEFRKPLEERLTVIANMSAPAETKDNLRAFVLKYGNSVVQYKDKALYVTANDESVSFQTVGQKVWAAV